jgi:hypothetical protein
MTKLFYRISALQNAQSLWYDLNGNFTGDIHNRYSFCANSGLLMPHDPELTGYLSVANDLEHLKQWFSNADIKRLQLEGFAIHEYQATDYKFYQPFQHQVISQATSKLLRTFTL